MILSAFRKNRFFVTLCLLVAILQLPSGVAVADEEKTSAAEKLEQMQNLFYARLSAKKELADTYRETGNLDESVKTLEEIIQQKAPADFSIKGQSQLIDLQICSLQGLQEIYSEAKPDNDKALTCMKKALILMDKRVEKEAWHNEEKISLLKSIASVLRKMGKPQEAIKYLKQASKGLSEN